MVLGIITDMAQELDKPPSFEEVQNVVWACGSDKAPQPDRFYFKFIKRIWDLLQFDILFIKFLAH